MSSYAALRAFQLVCAMRSAIGSFLASASMRCSSSILAGARRAAPALPAPRGLLGGAKGLTDGAKVDLPHAAQQVGRGSLCVCWCVCLCACAAPVSTAVKVCSLGRLRSSRRSSRTRALQGPQPCLVGLQKLAVQKLGQLPVSNGNNNVVVQGSRHGRRSTHATERAHRGEQRAGTQEQEGRTGACQRLTWPGTGRVASNGAAPSEGATTPCTLEVL